MLSNMTIPLPFSSCRERANLSSRKERAPMYIVSFGSFLLKEYSPMTTALTTTSYFFKHSYISLVTRRRLSSSIPDFLNCFRFEKLYFLFIFSNAWLYGIRNCSSIEILHKQKKGPFILSCLSVSSTRRNLIKQV